MASQTISGTLQKHPFQSAAYGPVYSVSHDLLWFPLTFLSGVCVCAGDFEEARIEEQPMLPCFPSLNSRVTLTCGAVGVPDPNITWYKDNDLLPEERSRTLVIQEVQLSDRGTYRCQATNFNSNGGADNHFQIDSQEIFINIEGWLSKKDETLCYVEGTL